MRGAGALLRRWIGPRSASVPTLVLPDVLWFFGAIAAVAASIAIVDKIPESHRDSWEFLASLGFLAVYAFAGWLLLLGGWRLPGGLAAAMAAAMVPAAGYGFTQLVHAYPRRASFNPFEEFSGAVFAIAVATLLAALVAYALTRVTFNLLLAVGTLLVGAQLLATSWHPSLDGRATTAVVVGGALVLIALSLDAAAQRRVAFWPYVGGFFAIAWALGLYAFPGFHLDVWIAMLVIGAPLLLFFRPAGRATWAVFGAAYVAGAFAVSQVAADGRAGRAVWIGAVLLAVGLVLDATGRRRTAFWVQLGGFAALTAGLVYFAVPLRELDVWIALLVIGAFLLLFFAPVGRRTWAVFGAAYVAGAFAVSQVATEGRAGRAIWVGAVLVLIGLILDSRGRRSVGFWMHLGGLAAIAEGLAYFAITSPDSEAWIPMLVIGSLLLLFFAPYDRRTWAVFGAAFAAGAYATSELASGDGRAGTAIVVGAVIALVGLIHDARRRRSVGFWMHVAGLTGVGAALVDLAITSPHPETRAWIPMLVVGALLLVCSVPLQRRTWAVFGAAGLAGAFGHYLDTQSGWFAYVLLVVALAAFAAGLAARGVRATERTTP